MLFANNHSIIGFIIQIVTKQPKYQYMGTFFAAAGIYSNAPKTVAWNGNNIGGSTKRAVGIAMQVGFGNLGGILSGFTYTYHDAPLYHRGHGIVIGLLSMSTILCVLLRWWYVRENFNRFVKDMHSKPNGWTKQQMERESSMGDDAGFFRFTT